MDSPNTVSTIDLGELLHDFHLSLVLIAGADEDALLRPVQWVHSSELEDPTPVLTPRTVLLTTAARFNPESTQEEADSYVERLIASGTTALGIAVGLHWDRVPPVFVNACDRLRLPLIRVPYQTSFISIVQTAARLLDARSHARDAWLLESQRLVTNASLHRNGLGSAIRETAARLGRWVAITDRSGRITEFAPRSLRSEVSSDLIRREARRIVERGLRSGRIEHAAGTGMQLRALGRSGQVLGVLVLADAGTPDHAERTLIGLVEALATVQMEHRSGLEQAESTLRSSILELLLAGEVSLADRVSARIITRIPRDPVVVIHARGTDALAFADDLASFDAASSGLLRAEVDGDAIVVTEARHAPALRRLFALHHSPAGVSERGTMSTLAQLTEQAAQALRHAEAGGEHGPVIYRPAVHAKLFDLLDAQPTAVRRASARLAPIRVHDERHGDHLLESLRTWLAHHGQTSPAAAALGVHRQTLRTRVQTAASLLHADLNSPDARAEVWTALRLLNGTEQA